MPHAAPIRAARLLSRTASLALVGVLALVGFLRPAAAQTAQVQRENDALRPIPALLTTNGVTQLHVDGAAFLVLGAELGNSTAADLPTLARAMDRCAAMHANTLLLPVYWDRFEPEEGVFDPTLVRGAIDLARERNLRLVYLWFGTWKNSMSCYAPSWVKRDTERFPRVRTSAGEPLEIVSPACAAARAADARAFAALMRWTREYDGSHRTVVMAQVENEVGMIPEPRDHAAGSEAEYAAPVPDKLLDRAGRGELGDDIQALWRDAGGHEISSGDNSWANAFGDSPEAQEVFTAWQLASFVEAVAAAGKREYPLPIFANAALIRPGYRPGDYPAAGPLPHLMEVWRTAAPSVDMLCPDIYFPNFVEWIEKYDIAGNPVFVPEMAPSLRGPGNAVYALAAHNAIGFAPFALESVDDEKERRFENCVGRLSGFTDLILRAQREDRIIGLAPDISFDWRVDDQPATGTLGGVEFTARFDRPGDGRTDETELPTLGSHNWDAPPGTPLGSAMIIQLDDGEFLIFGMGVTITFSPAPGNESGRPAQGFGKIGIDWVREGTFGDAGEWQPARWLNGDQTHQGRHIHLYDGWWTAQRVKLYRY